MPNPENVIGKGKKFTKDFQPKNRGRKPNLYTQLKKSNLSKDDILNLFRLALELSPKDLKKEFNKIKDMEAISKTNDKPMIYYNIVSAIFKDLKTGSLYNIMSVLTRLFGYPKQDLGISGEITNKQEMTDEQVALLENDIKDILERKLKNDKTTG